MKIKILKDGVKPTKTKRLKCPECGCVFEADEGEYRLHAEEYYGTEIRAKCPFCGLEGYKNEVSRDEG